MKAAQESQSLLTAERDEDTEESKEISHEKTDNTEDKWSTVYGICSAMIVCAFISISAASVQMLRQSIPDLELNSFRTFVPLVLTTVTLLTKRKLPSVPEKGFGFVVGWSISTGSQCVLMYISVNYLPLGTSQSLIMTTSLAVGAVLFCIFLKEKISGFTLLGMLMAVLGIIFVIQLETLFGRNLNGEETGKETSLNKTTDDQTNIARSQLSMGDIGFKTVLFGFTFAVLSGICRATDSLTIKYLSTRINIIENIWNILFWSFMNQFLLFVTIMYFFESITYPQTITQVVWILAHGVSYLSSVAILHCGHYKTERNHICYSFEFVYNFIHAAWTIHISEEYSTRTSKLDRRYWNCAGYLWFNYHLSA